MERIEKLTASLSKAKNHFPKFIEYIRFPYFKNLEENTRIDFRFPVTALVGPNGCGKSSVLQALFGAPQGYSTGLFWFSTSMDPIEEGGGKRNCFIYGYKNKSGAAAEVLKTRIQWNKQEGNSKNPDYWEPSRPLKKYGMTTMGGQRHPAIDMEVQQIDFRFQLSAFDRYFYLEEMQPWHRAKRKSKQDVLRERSVYLKKSFSGEKVYSEKRVEGLNVLTEEELKVICAILGKNYVEGKVLRHKFYKEWGNSILFKSDSLSYSEANAGSGEVAVVLLVQKVMQAKPSSLILLDEPEYSLHPGAQKNLLRFLLDQSLKKQLQVIYTTHSPSMIESLPAGAIKVFETNPQGQFRVCADRIADEAFVSIGHTIVDRLVIRVEDALAKIVIDQVITRAFPGFSEAVDVQFYPGGSARIKEDISLYSLEMERGHVVVFDGDERRVDAIDPMTISQGEKSVLYYEQKIKECAGQSIAFTPDGGINGGREDQLMELQEKYLDFWRQRVFFFPFDKLEEEFWNVGLCRSKLEEVVECSEVEATLVEINALPPKKRFAALAQILFGQSRATEIQSLQTNFVKYWIKCHSKGYSDLVLVLRSIRELPKLSR